MDRKKKVVLVDRSHCIRAGLAEMFQHHIEIENAAARAVAYEMISHDPEIDAVVMTSQGYFDMIREVMEEKKVLSQEANTDPLTKLYNRRAFDRIVEERLSEAEEGVLFMVDLDNFKRANDRYGHNFGDDILILVAEAITAHLCKGDLAGRLGGDEFVIFLPGMADQEEVCRKAEEVCRALQMEVHGDFLSVSIGISRYPEDGTDYQMLLDKADQALYRAKERGKNCYMIYTEKH